MSEKNDKVEQLQADIEAGVAELVEGEESELSMGSFWRLGGLIRSGRR